MFTRFFLLVLLCPVLARADFQWASTKVFAAAAPSDGRAFAQFTFTNTGSYPIKITGAHTTCGCTAAIADAHAVAPGQSGTINVSFKTLNRHGLYEEPIVVDSDDPKTKESTIILRVLVQNPVELLPTLLFWQPGEPLTPKVIRITVADGFSGKDIAATCPDPGVQLQLETIKPGVEYKLTVTPKTPHVKAAISVSAEIDGKPSRVLTAHVRVS